MLESIWITSARRLSATASGKIQKHELVRIVTTERDTVQAEQQ